VIFRRLNLGKIKSLIESRPLPGKELIKKILRKFGYRITRAAAVERGFRAPHLARICQPKTVIDAGVGYGTPE
jgi:hypothetical protein